MTYAAGLCVCFGTALSAHLGAPDFLGCPASVAGACSPTPAADVRDLLNKTGITAEAACASGVTPTNLEQLFGAASAVLAASRTSLRDVEQAVQNARETLDLLTKRPSEAPVGASATIQQARAALLSALQAEAAAHSAAFDSICSELPEDVRSGLALLRLNGSRAVPTHLKMVARTEQEWAALEKAVARSVARHRAGLAALGSDVLVIQLAEGHPAVLAARTRLSAGLTALQEAWTPTSP